VADGGEDTDDGGEHRHSDDPNEAACVHQPL
jgi:hypothetical protein